MELIPVYNKLIEETTKKIVNKENEKKRLVILYGISSFPVDAQCRKDIAKIKQEILDEQILLKKYSKYIDDILDVIALNQQVHSIRYIKVIREPQTRFIIFRP